MVACPKCVVNNTLDSAFCKKCGAILPISMIEEEQEKLKEIVTKGMESYQSGNLDEAMAIADHSIITNPSYGEAYALKGLIHERKGAYAEAFDAYETVVALNPDSTIDKIKLNQLRNAFAVRQGGEPRADRKSAALMAVAAMVLVLSVGGISYGIIQSSKETKQGTSNNAPITQTNPLLNADQSKSTGQPGVNVNPNKQNPGPGEVKPTSDDNGTADTGTRTSSRSSGGGSRSYFGGSDGPIIVDPPSGPVGPKLPDPTHTAGNGTKITNTTPTPNNGGDTGKDDPQPTPSGSTMEISVSHPKGDGSGNSGGSGSIESATSSSTGKMYQRQGQTHQRSGKTAQAREAYQKAIDAYQKEIDSGKGDKDAATAGINSSRQALKNLKD